MNAQILTIRAIATSKIATTAPIMNALLPRKTKEKTPNSAIRMSAVTLALLLINDSDSVGVKMGEGATLPPIRGQLLQPGWGGETKAQTVQPEYHGTHQQPKVPTKPLPAAPLVSSSSMSDSSKGS